MGKQNTHHMQILFTLGVFFSILILAVVLTGCGTSDKAGSNTEEKPSSKNTASAVEVNSNGEFDAIWLATDDSGITFKFTYDQPSAYGSMLLITFNSLNVAGKSYNIKQLEGVTITVDGEDCDMPMVQLETEDGQHTDGPSSIEIKFSCEDIASASGYDSFNLGYDDCVYLFEQAGNTKPFDYKDLHLIATKS